MPYASVRGTEVHYVQSGEGPDVVWIGGGGMPGDEWRLFQTPDFDSDFRSTTFDNRGVGKTRLTGDEVWTIGEMADDAAALIEAVCSTPVVCVGLSMGALICQELACRRPDLVSLAIPMGTAAKATGWVYSYMDAEIEWRKAGKSLDGRLGATHYMAALYPASALSDDALCEYLLTSMSTPEWQTGNEDSLIPQWQACNEYDGRDALRNCQVPFHVIAFEQDVQAPPKWGREVAGLVPSSDFTLIPDAGHSSCVGHKHVEINRMIRKIIDSHRK